MFLNESRREYTKYDFDKNKALENPFQQFDDWYKFAQKNAVFEANAMHLSTVSKDNQPKNRVVLLKSYNENGFVFFSNYNSQKALDISYNSNVSLTFFWPNIERQVRIEGQAVRVSEKVSDDYFKTRPRESQLSAWASNQSEQITDREELEEKLKTYKEKFSSTIPRPDFWGGFNVKANYYEFWQGRENRYHDRIVYQKKSNHWEIYRLNP